MNRSAIMVGHAAQVIQVEDDRFAPANSHVAIGGKPADSIVRGGTGGRVIDIDPVIVRKVRIERHAKQAALTIGINGHGEKWRAEEHIIVNDTKLTGLLANE